MKRTSQPQKKFQKNLLVKHYFSFYLKDNFIICTYKTISYCTKKILSSFDYVTVFVPAKNGDIIRLGHNKKKFDL
ncbi:hypothetical protein BpHYR1_003029 [Brachionus plicatilis]|uniref:Uncharacterized protein n=1 Tax=Brachionus plicatilis TaxID=10195 RepID=A0A3M7S4I0_BRAPC|nr:hypothetical protein BpHYR1_003029 [Brachionus plicatilis]